MTSAEQKWERAAAQADAERPYWLRRTMRRRDQPPSPLAVLLVMVVVLAVLLGMVALGVAQ
ncbi:hypothetical protein [Auraticoccus monumenti]|uniref:Uncharacterized protein n=1 Tax=Auraticoccus monumenti TaxID=675864 RepID=A0A1G6UNA4_9ACTN|nr:hypothetical protein [Auraticoccus monumenti]SDD42216.1 hypothetical protein SAMN04489747_0915 [Auraticoccus monumenti]